MNAPGNRFQVLGFFLLVIAFLQTDAGFAAGKPIKIEARPVEFGILDPKNRTFGELTYLGGLQLDSPDPRFGGFSGLLITQNGTRLLSVSDQAWWLSARLTYDGAKLKGIKNARLGPLISPKGKRWKRKRSQDAEALALYGSNEASGALVGFERRTRMLHYKIGANGLTGRPKKIRVPKAMDKGRPNKELEAVGRFTSGPNAGKFIALSEVNLDKQGNIKGWIWKSIKSREKFSIKRRQKYSITDLAILRGGDIVLLERKLLFFKLPGVAMRLIPAKTIKRGAVLDGRVLMEAIAPAQLVDNMEGLSAHRAKNGDLIFTLISDDNYNRSIQRTLLLQFAWPASKQ